MRGYRRLVAGRNGGGLRGDLRPPVRDRHHDRLGVFRIAIVEDAQGGRGGWLLRQQGQRGRGHRVIRSLCGTAAEGQREGLGGRKRDPVGDGDGYVGRAALDHGGRIEGQGKLGGGVRSVIVTVVVVGVPALTPSGRAPKATATVSSPSMLSSATVTTDTVLLVSVGPNVTLAGTGV